MANIEFGHVPERLSVNLVNGSDFVQRLATADGTNWESGASLRLRFAIDPPVEWPAVITGDEASWRVDRADVATVLAACPCEVRLIYTDPTVGTDPDDTTYDLVFARGEAHAR